MFLLSLFGALVKVIAFIFISFFWVILGLSILGIILYKTFGLDKKGDQYMKVDQYDFLRKMAEEEEAKKKANKT